MRSPRRMFCITFVLLALWGLSPIVAQLPLEAVSPDAPEGYSDWVCSSPQNLTGLIPVGAGLYPSIVWDGSAYGVAYVSGSYIYFTRVAADGTALVSPTYVETNSYGSYEPSLVWTGSEYGLAWYDYRDGNYEIYFARLSAAGVKQGSEVRITNDASYSYAPSLVWRGSEYGVTWYDNRDGNYEIYFARISAAGVKQGSDVRITNDASYSYVPSLAWTGSEYGLAWFDYRDGNYEIYFARLTAAGVKQGSEVRITNDAATSYDPSLVWTGTEYGVAWEDYRDGNYEVYFCRMSPSGAKRGSDVRITTDIATSYYPSLAWTGAEYGVAWFDYRDGCNEVYFARISPLGAKLSGDYRLTATGDASNPALAFGTLGFGLVYTVWGATTQVGFTGVGCHNDTTSPLCPTGLEISANSGAGVSLTWLPGVETETEIAFHRVYRNNALLALTTASSYTDTPRPAGAPRYEVRAVNANGRESYDCDWVVAPLPEGTCGTPLTGERLLSQSTSTVQSPALAWSGREYGVVWYDWRAGNYDIYFARVAADGTKLGADSPLATNASSSIHPAIVWTGSEYGVAWMDSRDGNYEIYFARVAADGTKIGSEVRITNDGASAFDSAHPSLVWTGSEYGVAWYDLRDGNTEIYFARISEAGVKQGGDVRITNDFALAFSSLYPSLVWTGSEYGVAWMDYRDSNSEIYFARISAAGVKQGGDVRITTDTSSSEWPSLVWAGGEYGVAWDDYRDGNFEIYFSRLSSTGSKLGSDVRVTSASGNSYSPSLLWAGSEYALAWYDSRNGNLDIYHASLDASGFPKSEQRLSTTSTTEIYPRLAAGGKGIGLVYHRDVTQDQILFQGLGCGGADSTPPSCPSSPTITSRSATSLILVWGPSIENESDLGVYKVYRNGSLLGVTTATSWTDATYTAAGSWVYWVTATNAAGLESPACGSVDTTDRVPPTCAENLLASGVTPSQVTLNWLPSQDAGCGLKHYRLYRNDVELATVPAGTTTYTDTTLAALTTYNFAVKAEDYQGNLSPLCATSSVYVSTKPITLTMAKSADGPTLHLGWTDVGLGEYVVYRSPSPQTASELKRVILPETTDAVLNDGVPLWFYYIQQRD